MCDSLCIHMYVCMYLCVCVSVYTCLHVSVCVCVCVCMSASYMYDCVCICVCVSDDSCNILCNIIELILFKVKIWPKNMLKEKYFQPEHE